MPSTKKTYTLLIDIQPPIPILSCSQVLPNRMQCWRGADYLVEEEIPAPPAPQTHPASSTIASTSQSATTQKEGPIRTLEHKIVDAIEHRKEEVKTTTADAAAAEKAALTPTPLNPEPQTATMRSFQLCTMHATIMQRADALADQQEASGIAQPPAGEKGSIHSRMMQAEQAQRTTSMPRGEARG